MTIKDQRFATVRTDSRGMASILITMVTMIVVTLIVLGFATIAQREQGNTTDQQLSTQAFYAAESAINDARYVINSAVQNSLAIPGKSSCNTNTDGPGYTPNFPVPSGGNSGVVLDSTNNTSYTCLLVDPTPSSMVQDGVGDNSWVVPVTSTTAFDTIEIQWTPDPAVAGGNPSTDCPATLGEFDPASGAGAWTCGYGVLRMDLEPTSGPLTTASMTSNQLTGFFEPQSSAGGGSLTDNAANRGQANVKTANCNTGSYTSCTATISVPSGTSYTLRINSLYETSDVTVTALNGGPSGTPVPTNGQVSVDATGQANGVLRRIQVRLPVSDFNGLIPRYALESNSAVCKRYLVTPTYYSNAGDVINPEPNTPADPDFANYNAMCDNALPSSGSP